MKVSFKRLIPWVSLFAAVPAWATPEPCSISVGIRVRSGLTFRTWTNALETMKLEEKGLRICQDDAVLSLSDERLAELDEAGAAALLKCRTEFKLEMLYYGSRSGKPSTTRNVTIFGSEGRVLFDRDYEGNPASQRILKTIPTCVELQAADRAR